MRALAILLLAPAAAAQSLLVVTPDSFAPATAEWRAYREGQGHAVAVRGPGDDVGATVKAAHAASGGALRFILLLGDTGQVPCAWFDAEIIQRYEDDPRASTDNPYADLDGDSLPDVAIGRLPARTPQEARELLARAVAYEKDADFGTWRRRMSVVAGVGGFGEREDKALETTTR
ncbi:MAG: C25 family cysteine peptidase, partial [Planctomycetota bacterium]